MTNLISYTALPSDLQIKADLQIHQSILQLKFQIQNTNPEVKFINSSFQALGHQMTRKDELWKDTCFECFLNPVAESLYYEFNFNLQGGWNCYMFDEYRKPQPAKASSDFDVKSFSWTDSELNIELKNLSKFQKFNVGITAIIKDKNNQTYYFALKHAGEKPDFHLQNSFILQRGS